MSPLSPATVPGGSSASKEFRDIGLTREEDGVGISAGAYLAGARPLVVIQSSGLGNMFNALLSLTVTYGLPLPILASWRGGEGKHPAQVPFNRSLPGILSAAGIPFSIISSSDRRSEIGCAIDSAYTCRTPHVILLQPGCLDDSGISRNPEIRIPLVRPIPLDTRGNGMHPP